MHQLLMITAAMMGFNAILEDMQSSLDKCRTVMAVSHDEDEIKEAQNKLAFSCLLFSTKLRTGDDMGKAIELSEEFEKTLKAQELLNPNKS